MGCLLWPISWWVGRRIKRVFDAYETIADYEPPGATSDDTTGGVV